jgi:hypothetical protein
MRQPLNRAFRIEPPKPGPELALLTATNLYSNFGYVSPIEWKLSYRLGQLRAAFCLAGQARAAAFTEVRRCTRPLVCSA